LRGGPASAADYLHVSREQHLKRLASTLEKDEINIQTIALERAGFLVTYSTSMPPLILASPRRRCFGL